VRNMPADTKIRPQIEITAVHKSYFIDGGKESVMDGVDMTVNDGKFVSIIVHSGLRLRARSLATTTTKRGLTCTPALERRVL